MCVCVAEIISQCYLGHLLSSLHATSANPLVPGVRSVCCRWYRQRLRWRWCSQWDSVNHRRTHRRRGWRLAMMTGRPRGRVAAVCEVPPWCCSTQSRLQRRSSENTPTDLTRFSCRCPLPSLDLQQHNVDLLQIGLLIHQLSTTCTRAKYWNPLYCIFCC